MIEIPGDYLEGGGQIVRTAVVLSCISSRPVRIFNIRAKRPNPGIKPQLYYTLKSVAKLVHARTEGLELDSPQIVFAPQKETIMETRVDIDLKTSGAIGLALQILLPVAAFKSKGIIFNIMGGTCGLGSVPVDYYPRVVFPLLKSSGIIAEMEILRRGYYPKGQGRVRVKVDPIKRPKGIFLRRQGKVIFVNGLSIASSCLHNSRVSQRQADRAEGILKTGLNVPVRIETEYADTSSPGSEINLFAHTDTGCILWSDARGQKGKTAQKTGEEAADKLIKEIYSQAAVDHHFADNVIPWLCFLGGEVKTSRISTHTRTNIWVCEQFFGEKFKIEDSVIISNRTLK